MWPHDQPNSGDRHERDQRHVPARDRDDVIGAGRLKPAFDLVRESRAVADQNRGDDRRLLIAEIVAAHGGSDVPPDGCSRLVPRGPVLHHDQRRALDGAGQVERPAQRLPKRVQTARIHQLLRPPERDRRLDRPARGPLGRPIPGEIAADVRLHAAAHRQPPTLVLNLANVDDQSHAEFGAGGISRQAASREDRT